MPEKSRKPVLKTLLNIVGRSGIQNSEIVILIQYFREIHLVEYRLKNIVIIPAVNLITNYLKNIIN